MKVLLSDDFKQLMADMLTLPHLLLLFCFILSLSEAGSLSDPSLPCHDIVTAPENHGLLWWLHISDIHFSAYVPQRDEDFARFMPPLLSLVKPALLAITGDLTDAKNSRRTVTRQDESEWKRYKQVMEDVCHESGFSLHSMADLRGNHDTFEVPERNEFLDFYSRYSTSATLNRTRNCNKSISSLTVQAGPHVNHLFVSIDTSPRIGLRGPSNFFGHPTDGDLDDLDRVLSQHDSPSVRKVVIGHYPIAFVARAPSGRRLQDVLANHSIAAYLPGHLHYKFGTKMFRRHSPSSPGSFWELGAGDWKDNRMIRLMAMDAGQVSFLEVKLVRSEECDSLSDVGRCRSSAIEREPLILITNPADATFFPGGPRESSREQASEIRVLVFSAHSVLNVTAFIYDSTKPDASPAASFVLHHEASQPLYSAPWDPSAFSSDSPLRFTMAACVQTALHLTTCTPRQPLSLSAASAPLQQQWLEYTVMHTDWEAMWPLTLSILLAAAWLILLLPRVVHSALLTAKQREDLRARVVAHVTGTTAASLRCRDPAAESLLAGDKGESESESESGRSEQDSRNVQAPLIQSPAAETRPCTCPLVLVYCWMAMEASVSPLWWLQLGALFFTSVGPCFWGQPTGEGLPPGTMSVWGWSAVSRVGGPHIRGLAVPDILTVVVPYLVLCLLPLLLWVPLYQGLNVLLALVKEAEHSQAGKEEVWVKGSTSSQLSDRQCDEWSWRQGPARRRAHGSASCLEGMAASDSSCTNSPQAPSEGGKRQSRIRRVIFVGRLILWTYGLGMAYFTLWQLRMVSHAYGGLAIALSPGYAWLPILVLIYVCVGPCIALSK